MKNLSRRSFLKSSSAIAAGAIFIPKFISCSPNNRLNIAVIGVGGRGSDNWLQTVMVEDVEGGTGEKKPKRVPLNNIVAMCDVDDKRAAEGYRICPDAKRYKDFRVMFDEMASEIDAVIISTPDHTHFAAAMAAIELGKHVYVEKPLAHNIWQLRTLKKAAKHYGIVSQMGNQGHTTNGIRLVKEWYEAGVLGQVKEVIAWQGPINFREDGYFALPDSFPPQAEPIPDYLDWDLWLGPAAKRDFNNIYAPKTWRGFFDFGNGKLGDWACHTLDAPFWALDLGLPHSVEGTVPNPVPDHSFVAEESLVTWQFGARGDKAPVTMKWYEGMEKPAVRPEWGIDELPGSGMIMIGDKKTLITGGRPNQPKLLVSDEEWKEFRANAPERTYPRIGEEQPVQEWLDAIKNNTLPGSNFDYSATFTEVAQVGVLAQRFGGKLEYDAEKMTVTNRPELDAYIKEPVREGWAFGDNLWK